MKWHPNSLTWQLHSKFGMKQGLEGRTRAQRQGDFMDNSNIWEDFGTTIGHMKVSEKKRGKRFNLALNF